ncbi:MAG TPA: ribosome biogenesis GTPase YlqF [Bacillota bacterium]
MEIQWYPGHMAKSRRELKEILPLINLVVEVADARLPKSSRNPDLHKILGNKPRVLLLNKSDLGEAEKVAAWVAYYTSRQERVLPFNAKTGEGLSQLSQVFAEAAAALGRTRAGKSRQLRICVVGVPNVGKSSVLNRLVGRNAARVGNRPGVTKGRQWVKKGCWEVLDTPGLLWPKIEDEMTGWLLAFTGTIKPELLHPEELALRLIQMLAEEYPSRLKKVYGLSHLDQAGQVLEAIGRKRGCLVKGGQVDWLRAANLVWNDFRSGALGRFTLEDPPLSFPC